MSVVIRELHGMPDMQAAEALMMRVWGCGRDSVPLLAATMQALSHAGNYVSGAFLDSAAPGTMIGCTIGFFGPPGSRTMHSHVAAVESGHAGAGIGTAMKFHQRDWCLERATTTMTWTYDPLVARNAYFNLESLGAEPSEYLVDFYGPMEDEINRGRPSDRVLVNWDLTAADRRQQRTDRGAWRRERTPNGTPLLVIGPGDEPLVYEHASDVTTAIADADTLLIGIPADIETMRIRQPDLAEAWREVTRPLLDRLITGTTHRIVGFDARAGYIAERVS